MADAPKKSGLSLYSHLLDSSASTISGAPVKYDQQKIADDAAAAQKKKEQDASLKFQPSIRRPQTKSKPKAPSTNTSSSAHKFSSSITTASTVPQGISSTPNVQRTNFEDWIGDDEEEFYVQDRKPNNRRNKKKKKKKQYQQEQEIRILNWDEIYDPARPNNYADWNDSEERIRERLDWKARLKCHVPKGADSVKKNSREQCQPANNLSALPVSFDFAPRSFENDEPSQPMDLDDKNDHHPRKPPGSDGLPHDAFAPPSFAQPGLSDDATGDDAYVRRMRMSGMPPPANSPPMQSSPPKQAAPPVQPSQSPPAPQTDIERAAKLADIKAKIAGIAAKRANASASAVSSDPNSSSSQPLAEQAPTQEPSPPPPPPPPPPAEPAGTISRAAVRYDVPPPSATDETAILGTDQSNAEDQLRSTMPGQKGFGARLLKKYGWQKGQGLGASGEGIITPLAVKADKSKGQKRTDPDGGRLPSIAMGKIVGGKRRKIEGADDNDEGRFGKMSDVVKLEGMLAGLDVQKEIEDNNLMQEIGEDFNKNYGTVKRVLVWREEKGGKNEVLVRFVSQMSAWNAVQAMNETTFADNKVVARFFDSEKFEEFENGEWGV